MDICFTAHEARVIGCLLEKQVTTPEHYPLSLNALKNACNQKSSRDPVMALDEQTVQSTIDSLIKDRYITEKRSSGSRVPKYQHRFCNTEFGDLKFSDQEFGIVCVLLLRGAQTPGELRTRTDRLCKFQDVHEVESTLDQLMQHDDGPFVVKLPREPGKREIRYSHLLSGEVESTEAVVSGSCESSDSGTDVDRIGQLEQMVVQLCDDVAMLKERVNSIDPNQDSA